MSRFLLAVCLIGITGCGFKPLHQQKGPVNSASLPFYLKVMGNNDDAYTTYRFKQELLTLLSKLRLPQTQKFEIRINLSEGYGDIGYGADATVLRSQGRVAAAIQMYDSDDKPFYENTLDIVSSYTINESEEFSNLNAKNATRDRLIIALAQDVAREISMVLRKLSDNPNVYKTTYFKPRKISESSLFPKKNLDTKDNNS
ncbi:MAG: hypothetical protein K2W94_02890 [Alphaproteobacteria bacterium]|nr:hypothetical protein [Alphaproteobacteria bacterium]